MTDLLIICAGLSFLYFLAWLEKTRRREVPIVLMPPIKVVRMFGRNPKNTREWRVTIQVGEQHHIVNFDGVFWKTARARLMAKVLVGELQRCDVFWFEQQCLEHVMERERV